MPKEENAKNANDSGFLIISALVPKQAGGLERKFLLAAKTKLDTSNNNQPNKSGPIPLGGHPSIDAISKIPTESLREAAVRNALKGTGASNNVLNAALTTAGYPPLVGDSGELKNLDKLIPIQTTEVTNPDNLAPKGGAMLPPSKSEYFLLDLGQLTSEKFNAFADALTPTGDVGGLAWVSETDFTIREEKGKSKASNVPVEVKFPNPKKQSELGNVGGMEAFVFTDDKTSVKGDNRRAFRQALDVTKAIDNNQPFDVANVRRQYQITTDKNKRQVIQLNTTDCKFTQADNPQHFSPEQQQQLSKDLAPEKAFHLPLKDLFVLISGEQLPASLVSSDAYKVVLEKSILELSGAEAKKIWEVMNDEVWPYKMTLDFPEPKDLNVERPRSAYKEFCNNSVKFAVEQTLQTLAAGDASGFAVKTGFEKKNNDPVLLPPSQPDGGLTDEKNNLLKLQQSYCAPLLNLIAARTYELDVNTQKYLIAKLAETTVENVLKQVVNPEVKTSGTEKVAEAALINAVGNAAKSKKVGELSSIQSQYLLDVLASNEACKNLLKVLPTLEKKLLDSCTVQDAPKLDATKFELNTLRQGMALRSLQQTLNLNLMSAQELLKRKKEIQNEINGANVVLGKIPASDQEKQLLQIERLRNHYRIQELESLEKALTKRNELKIDEQLKKTTKVLLGNEISDLLKVGDPLSDDPDLTLPLSALLQQEEKLTSVINKLENILKAKPPKGLEKPDGDEKSEAKTAREKKVAIVNEVMQLLEVLKIQANIQKDKATTEDNVKKLKEMKRKVIGWQVLQTKESKLGDEQVKKIIAIQDVSLPLLDSYIDAGEKYLAGVQQQKDTEEKKEKEEREKEEKKDEQEFKKFKEEVTKPLSKEEIENLGIKPMDSKSEPLNEIMLSKRDPNSTTPAKYIRATATYDSSQQGKNPVMQKVHFDNLTTDSLVKMREAIKQVADNFNKKLKDAIEKGDLKELKKYQKLLNISDPTGDDAKTDDAQIKYLKKKLGEVKIEDDMQNDNKGEEKHHFVYTLDKTKYTVGGALFQQLALEVTHEMRKSNTGQTLILDDSKRKEDDQVSKDTQQFGYDYKKYVESLGSSPEEAPLGPVPLLSAVQKSVLSQQTNIREAPITAKFFDLVKKRYPTMFTFMKTDRRRLDPSPNAKELVQELQSVYDSRLNESRVRQGELLQMRNNSKSGNFEKLKREVNLYKKDASIRHFNEDPLLASSTLAQVDLKNWHHLVETVELLSMIPTELQEQKKYYGDELKKLKIKYETIVARINALTPGKTIGNNDVSDLVDISRRMFHYRDLLSFTETLLTENQTLQTEVSKVFLPSNAVVSEIGIKDKNVDPVLVSLNRFVIVEREIRKLIPANKDASVTGVAKAIEGLQQQQREILNKLTTDELFRMRNAVVSAQSALGPDAKKFGGQLGKSAGGLLTSEQEAKGAQYNFYEDFIKELDSYQKKNEQPKPMSNQDKSKAKKELGDEKEELQGKIAARKGLYVKLELGKKKDEHLGKIKGLENDNNLKKAFGKMSSSGKNANELLNLFGKQEELREGLKDINNDAEPSVDDQWIKKNDAATCYVGSSGVIHRGVNRPTADQEVEKRLEENLRHNLRWLEKKCDELQPKGKKECNEDLQRNEKEINKLMKEVNNLSKKLSIDPVPPDDEEEQIPYQP